MRAMDFFFVDGKNTSFADVLLSRRVTGESLFVATYGFGSEQVRRLMGAFDNFVLVADESHSIISKIAYKAVVNMSKNSDRFEFRAIRNHAKFAIVDSEVFILTSANLSKNGKRELYFICPASSDIMEKIKHEFGPHEIRKSSTDILDSAFSITLRDL